MTEDGIRVGTFLPPELFQAGVDERRQVLAGVAESGVDHVGVGDHVSFIVGVGFDGLIQSASLLGLHPTLEVHVGVYLLALRHPVTVARQLADLASMAPGRLRLGVGVGGEDRHEFEVCGVDPATRGQRTDESLRIVRRLLAGETVDNDGPHFPLQGARILPVPSQPLPIVIGGRSDAAIRRAATLGDGWLAIWVSARRYAEAVGDIEQQAAAAARQDVAWQHGLQVWCGFGDGPDDARAALAPTMEAMYQLPFGSFERYSPCGDPTQVAEFLSPYIDAGCRSFNLIPVARSVEVAMAGVAEVRRALNA